MAKIVGVNAKRQANFTEEMLNALSLLHTDLFRYYTKYNFLKYGVLASTLTDNVLLPTVTSAGGGQVTIHISKGSGVNSQGDLIEVESGLTASYTISEVLNKTLFIKYLVENSTALTTKDSHHNTHKAAKVKSQDTTKILIWRDYTPSTDEFVNSFPTEIPLGKLVLSGSNYVFDESSGYRRIAMLNLPVVGTGLYTDEITPSVTFPTNIQNFIACNGHEESRAVTNPNAMSTTDLGKLLPTFKQMIKHSGVPTDFKPKDPSRNWFLTTDTGNGGISVGSTGQNLIDKEGHLLTLNEPKTFTLASGETKHIVFRYKEVAGKDSAEMVALDTAPSDRGTYLSQVTYLGGTSCSIKDKRQPLIMRSFAPKMEKEKAGTHNELEDIITERTVPMPIILSIESDIPEMHGSTNAALSTAPKALTTNQGTPSGTLRVWIGDIIEGSRNSSNHKKIEFDMGTSKAGVGSYGVDSWIIDPPGYYYLVNEEETWYSKIKSNGTNFVIVEDDYPTDSNTVFYICPYAKAYVGKATPYKTIATGTYHYTPHPWPHVPLPPPETFPIIPEPKFVKMSTHVVVGSSPVEPVVVIEGCALASRYKIEVASVISSDVNTAWATCDFILGKDIRDANCWDVSAEYIEVAPAINGVRGRIPDKGAETTPDYWEITYTIGDENGSVPEDPDPQNTIHEHRAVHGRDFTLSIPPGRIVKVVAQGIHKRMTMRECVSGSLNTKLVYGKDSNGNSFVAAGGANVFINDKMYNTNARITALSSGQTKPVGKVSITHASKIKRIHLWNNESTSLSNFRIWVHEGTANPNTGQNIQIGGQGYDSPTLPADGDIEKDLTISLYNKIAVSLENFASGEFSGDIDIAVFYAEE